MTRANVAVVVQVAVLGALVALALTSERWVPSLVPDPDIGTGLAIVRLFGIGILALSIGLAWATFLSWLEYRRGLRNVQSRVTLVVGAIVAAGLTLYTLMYWGAL